MQRLAGQEMDDRLKSIRHGVDRPRQSRVDVWRFGLDRNLFGRGGLGFTHDLREAHFLSPVNAVR